MKISNTNIGESFEKYVAKCLELKGFDVERIPDGCKQVSQFKIIRVKAPFDFLATKTGIALYFDAKTTQGETFPFSAIDQNQVEKLLKIHNNGFVAGYIINFRQNNTYCFIDAKMLSEVVERGSIKSRACIDLGKEIDIDKLFSFEKANTSIN